MIQSNKIFRAHSGCWDSGSTDAKSNMTHLRIYGRKIIFRHFQLVRISYHKLNFHGISRFSAVFITNNLNAWRYNSQFRNHGYKSLFRLFFNRSEKKFPTLALVSSETCLSLALHFSQSIC
jgi:hypothetical protein